MSRQQQWTCNIGNIGNISNLFGLLPNYKNRYLSVSPGVWIKYE